MPPPSTPAGAGAGAEAETGLAGAALERAKGAGGEVAQAARTRARSEFDRRSAEAAERVRGTAADVRDVAEELRRKGKDGPARLAEQAANQIERVSAYLRDADLERVGSDVGRLGRSRPAALVIGAAAVGVVAGRILKASSSGSEAQRGNGTESRPARAGGGGDQ